MEGKVRHTADEISLATLQVTLKQLQHIVQEGGCRIDSLRLDHFREQDAERRAAGLCLSISRMVD